MVDILGTLNSTQDMMFGNLGKYVVMIFCISCKLRLDCNNNQNGA